LKALKKVRLEEDGLQFIENHPEPEAAPAEVKIRVLAAGICGTDFAIYHSSSRPGIQGEMLRHHGGEPSRYQPIAIGHEFCGEVVEVDAGVPKDFVRIGDYVTGEMHLALSKSGLADFVRIAAWAHLTVIGASSGRPTPSLQHLGDLLRGPLHLRFTDHVGRHEVEHVPERAQQQTAA